MICPNYSLGLTLDEGGYPEDWMWMVEGVADKDMERLFGPDNEENRRSIKSRSMHGFHESSYKELWADVKESNRVVLSTHSRLLRQTIVRFACHKAVHAQDKDGMSWYDAQFGHMPWLYDEECDDEKIAAQVKSTRGAYGIPLSWYGHIQGRPNPDYWML